MTDLTPGSRWLLPVTMDFVAPYLNAPRKRVVWWMTFLGGRSVCADPAELSGLIPADRITELEAEVAHWRKLYEDASAANSDMQKRNLEKLK